MQIYTWSFLLSMPLGFEPQDNLSGNYFPRYLFFFFNWNQWSGFFNWNQVFKKEFRNEKKNMFYSSHLRGLNHLLWFCGLYSFYCLRVLVNIMCTCFLFHHPQSQIASSLKEKHCLLQFIMSLCNPGKSGL